MRCKPLALATAMLAICAPASAKNPASGWFMGADVGTSNLDGNVEYLGVATVDFDESATAFTVHAGYRFNRFIALGANYSDFGNFSVTRPGLRLDAGVEMAGINFNLRIPFNERFGLLATMSAQYRKLDLTANAPGETPVVQQNRGLQTRAALGLGYRINEHLDVRLDYGYTGGIGFVFMMMGTPTLHFDGDLTSLTAGLRYKF